MAIRTVLHLIDTTGPGGAETVFTDLARGLDPARYRSVAVTAGPGWVEDTIDAGGVQRHTVRQRGKFALRYVRALGRLALTIVTGVAITRAHGQATTSNVSPRWNQSNPVPHPKKGGPIMVSSAMAVTAGV